MMPFWPSSAYRSVKGLDGETETLPDDRRVQLPANTSDMLVVLVPFVNDAELLRPSTAGREGIAHPAHRPILGGTVFHEPEVRRPSRAPDGPTQASVIGGERSMQRVEMGPLRRVGAPSRARAPLLWLT
jgi:hypothetical protein